MYRNTLRLSVMGQLNNILGILASILSIIAFFVSFHSVNKVKKIEKDVNNKLNLKINQPRHEIFTHKKANSGDNGTSVVGDGNNISGGR